MTKECVKKKRDRLIRVEERGRKVLFKNEERAEYHDIQVDGCLILEGPRADRLIRKDGVASVVIELKGSGVEHACKQLFATITHESTRDHIEKKVGFVIVCRRYPRFDSYVLKAKRDAAKRFGAGLHIFCDQRTVSIEAVASIDGKGI